MTTLADGCGRIPLLIVSVKADCSLGDVCAKIVLFLPTGNSIAPVLAECRLVYINVIYASCRFRYLCDLEHLAACSALVYIIII